MTVMMVPLAALAAVIFDVASRTTAFRESQLTGSPLSVHVNLVWSESAKRCQ